MNESGRVNGNFKLHVAVALAGVLICAACRSAPLLAGASERQLQTVTVEARRLPVEAERARGEAGSASAVAADTARSEQLQRQFVHARVIESGPAPALEGVLFASGSATLGRGNRDRLGKLAVFLKSDPGRAVVIEGYTDSQGTEPYNVGLSLRRANRVKSYLTGRGVGTFRLTVVANGDSNPVASNDFAAGRQLNRRVEVVIVGRPPVS